MTVRLGALADGGRDGSPAPQLLSLIGQIRARLDGSAYVNEAAITTGVVNPILAQIGWDTADPQQLVPEYTVGKRRVDLALLGAGRRPAVFIEVKGVGRALDGDRQLIEYAFHEGVPLCILTDGREWSFYLPSGQGSYNDRRVYRLQLDDRDPTECARVLTRYVARERVLNGAAFEAAQHDHRDVAGRRTAAAVIPLAWQQLLAGPEDLLIELISDRAEAESGHKPAVLDVLDFLRSLRSDVPAASTTERRVVPIAVATARPATVLALATDDPAPAPARGLHYQLFGKSQSAGNANEALVNILAAFAARDPSKLEALAQAVQGRSRNHVARTTAEIYPSRPDLARAEEFAPGWLVGLNVSNQQKISILRTACDVFGLSMPGDLVIQLPNAT